MSPVNPRSERAARSVNLGAWFGPQLGGTAWLITGAVEFGAAAPRIALAWVACFAVANAAGTWLWFRCRRGQFRPLRGLQVLILLIGIVGLAAFAILDRAAPPAVRAMGNPRDGYRLLLVGVPLLVLMLALVDRTPVPHAPAGPTQDPPHPGSNPPPGPTPR